MTSFVGYRSPGVLLEEVFPSTGAQLRTGVPAFLGYAAPTSPGSDRSPRRLTAAPRFDPFNRVEDTIGSPAGSYLAFAVQAFFANGGAVCWIVPLEDTGDPLVDLYNGLAELDGLEGPDTPDLLCAPDIMRPRPHPNEPGRLLPPEPALVRVLQNALLAHCDRVGDCFALLDARPCATVEAVLDQRASLSSPNGALYYPWVKVAGGRDADSAAAAAPGLGGAVQAPDCPRLLAGFVPPCGHVAGVYARSDGRAGVHKAPANEDLEGVLDLEVHVDNRVQDQLNPAAVNCLRAFPGRGIRIWGARTLSAEPAWTYVNVRRLFITAARWIEQNMAGAVFEPNDPGLWARIHRDLTAYFDDLLRRGALKGASPEEAFYVKCDAETNQSATRDLGQVIAEIGLAPALPNEFVVVRIIRSAGGVQIAT